ncbi:hypothetical protein HY630_00350 [Candidatus Uhrbacteria bacterium]|nr:hypothetical protein [Candidatus Uhrbacteria bacterium]
MEMGDKIIEKLIEMDQKIEDIRSDMATKININELRTVLDNQGVILQRLDQERIFTLERIKRIEADVDKMKVVLHIA